MSPLIAIPLIIFISLTPLYFTLFRYWKNSKKIPRPKYGALDLLLGITMGIAYSLPGLVIGLLLYLLSYILA